MMGYFRFSLATLAVSVVPIACACGALSSGSRLWANATFSFTLVLLLLATVGTRLAPAHRRTWWAGFAVFGWAYFVLALGPWFRESLARNLVTSEILRRLYPWWELSGMTGTSESRGYLIEEGFFRLVGHSVFTLAAAVLGGMLAAAAYGRRESSHDR